jgi:WD domain, G-beta repeat
LLRTDHCAVFCSCGVIAFTLYADDEINEPSSIQLWRLSTDRSQFQLEVNLSSHNPLRETVSAITTSEGVCAAGRDFLITGQADSSIWLRNIHDFLPARSQKSTKKKENSVSFLQEKKSERELSCILRGHTEPAYALAVWARGNYPRLLISGSGDSTLRVWELDACERNTVTRSCLKILRGHSSFVYCLDVSSEPTRCGCDVPFVLSGGVDAKLYLWNLGSVLYDLNWSRRRSFCLFLTGCRLLDRSSRDDGARISQQLCHKIALALRPSAYGSSPDLGKQKKSHQSPQSVPDKHYATRGKRCRVFSRSEEKRLQQEEAQMTWLALQKKMESSLTRKHNKEEVVDGSNPEDIRVHIEEESADKDPTFCLDVAEICTLRKIGLGLRSVSAKKTLAPPQKPRCKSISCSQALAVFQSQFMCSLIASFL